ncbi:hypothetical protein CDD82_3157 [Ophiocordyceps australis]|uniref:Uncharacterized protein n=1 Tax=Ophiocordyceps australis TaxID=1399860 RepID=A0A2C5Z8Q2_9HYPO|nr:hypothetical protein CDD82_3157 [Ophiocordyceps australis]
MAQPMAENPDLNDATQSSSISDELQQGASNSSIDEKLKKKSHVDRPGWKPRSMSAPVLGSFAVLSLILAIAIECLAQYSRINGGLALSPSIREIPDYASALSRFSPMIIAIFYNLFWSWIDHDVKRMQPWFELSKPQGSRAKDSLFLTYPQDFMVFVPWRSARKRQAQNRLCFDVFLIHWNVCLSSTVMLIIALALTPLQSLIMSPGTVSKVKSVNIASRSSFSPWDAQFTTIVHQFQSTAFRLAAFDTKYPPFVSPEYALAPFSVEPDGYMGRANLTAQTTKYFAELNCWSTNFSVSETPTLQGPLPKYVLSDTHGCKVVVMELSGVTTDITAFLWRWNWDDSNNSTRSPECFDTPESTHQLTVLFSRNTKYGKDSKAEQGKPQIAHTSMYCQAQYYQQQVMATVNADGFRPYDGLVKPVSDKVPFDASNFNLTLFEAIASHESYDRTVTVDGPNLEVDHGEKLGFTAWADYYINWEYPAPFIYSKPNFSEEILYDSHAFEFELKHTFKFLFSLAVSQTLTNETTEIDQETASLSSQMAGIIVSRVFSALVESLFVLNAALTLILLYTCQKSQCCLTLNPNSISRLCGIDCHADVDKAFSKASNLDEKSLGLILGHEMFRLCQNHQERGAGINLERLTFSEDQDMHSLSTKANKKKANIRPFALTQRAGTLLVVILIGSLATLIVLKMREVAQNGLSRPSKKPLALRVITKYIPTIFATLLEAFWILLNRHYCTLQPFQKLCAGKARPSKTIETTYSAVPPPLALWRAIKAHHFNLASVCAVALLGNLLGIGLGALLNENETTIQYPHGFSPIHRDFTKFNSLFPVRELNLSPRHFQYLLANMSSNVPLSPWVSKDYFFKPYSVGDKESTGNYMLRTRGYGVRANCKPIPRLPIPTHLNNSMRAWANTSWCDGDGVELTGWHWAIGTVLQWSDLILDSPMSAETETSPKSWIDSKIYSCPPEIITSWGRRSSIHSEIHASAVQCWPSLDVATFDVVVDGMGLVQSYTRVSNISLESSIEHSLTRVLKTTTQIPGGDGIINWHNDILSHSSMSDMILALSGERDFLNATLPPPDPSKLVPIVEEVFQRYFSMTLEINQDKLNLPEANDSATGYMLATERRIFMDNRALAIALAVLSIDILFAAIFSTWPWDVIRVLPRMPNDLASTFAYIVPGRLMTTAWRDRNSGETTLSFGRYTGLDGQEHIGIEFDSNVHLVEGKRPSWSEKLKKKQSGGKSSEKSWCYRLMNRRRNDS